MWDGTEPEAGADQVLEDSHSRPRVTARYLLVLVLGLVRGDLGRASHSPRPSHVEMLAAEGVVTTDCRPVQTHGRRLCDTRMEEIRHFGMVRRSNRSMS